MPFYRVAQEALRNVVRHADARTAEIRIAPVGGVELTVTDDGQGFAVGTRSEGLGLISMSERMGQIGGSLTVDSKPGRGTVVRARVPVPGS